MRAPLYKCESPKYFFKFIKPGPMAQLSIPISFRKYIKHRRVNKTAILKRGCQKWNVKIIDWAFSEGWDNFVRENGVQEFDFVVFKHEGNMVFSTMVFDNTWCERKYLNNQFTESSRKCKIDTNALKKLPEKKDTIPSHIHHPYFTGTLGAQCKHRLYLPINFVRSNRLSAEKMTLRNGQSQLSWTVKLKIWSKDSKCFTYIGKGWHDFYIANGLKDGDHFKLELIRTGIKPVANFYTLKISKGKDKYINQSRNLLLKAEKSLEVPHQNHHPCFVGTLKQYGTSAMTMLLPKKFALENGLSNGEMIFKNMENEGLWIVNLRNHLDKNFFIRPGLPEFCSTIGLEKGDRFRFELIRNGNKPVAIVSRLPKAALINPYFRSIITANSLKRASVNVPLGFARSNNLVMRNCELFLIDEKQRLWPTHLSGSGDCVRISRVRDMWIANGLKEGDEFLLELVDIGNKPKMNFHRHGNTSV